MLPGDRIAQIGNKIDNGISVLSPYDYVIIHVGTNDIGDRAPYHSILSDYDNLIGIIRKKKRDINIIMSAIIPRPKDRALTDPMIGQINGYLQKVMSFCKPSPLFDNNTISSAYIRHGIKGSPIWT